MEAGPSPCGLPPRSSPSPSPGSSGVGSRRPLPAAVALVAVTAAIAGGRSATNGPVLAAGVALAAGAAIAADWERDHSPVLPLVAAAGIGTLLVGLGILGQRTGSASLPPVGPAVDSYRVEGMVILLAAAAL